LFLLINDSVNYL